MGKYIFANKLMFAIIMRDPIACKKFIEMIFPERTVEKILFPNKAEEDGGAATINEIAVEVEKTIITGIASKSVRLDVLFKGDDTVYDIEMQLEPEEEIAKRSRYYHMAIARNSLKKGETYDKLKTGYVIFVCCFDPFKRDEPVYRFEMYDRNLQLQLGDGSSTIILNTKCSRSKTPEAFEAFYNFVNTGKVDERNDFVKYLSKRVEEANEDEEVDRIMTLDEEMKVQWERAIEKGKELGFKQGEEIGFKQGEEIGRADKQREIAKKLRELGISIESISAATGLMPDEIKDIYTRAIYGVYILLQKNPPLLQVDFLYKQNDTNFISKDIRILRRHRFPELSQQSVRIWRSVRFFRRNRHESEVRDVRGQ